FEPRQPEPPPMFLSGPALAGNGEERARRPAQKRYNALGVLEDVAADGGEGSDATLDIAPSEPPAKGTAVRPEPTVHVAGKSSSLSKAVAASTAMGAGVPGAQGAGGQKDWSNVGRNDPCPCGSGKKFKKCHGANL
ncbi:MAG: SEC-C metal-binding domain-containing protein, partial [Gemmatimonadaceae bacterium]